MQKCRSGMAAVNPKKCCLFDIMTFIEPFLQSRKWLHQMGIINCS